MLTRDTIRGRLNARTDNKRQIIPMLSPVSVYARGIINHCSLGLFALYKKKMMNNEEYTYAVFRGNRCSGFFHTIEMLWCTTTFFFFTGNLSAEIIDPIFSFASIGAYK